MSTEQILVQASVDTSLVQIDVEELFTLEQIETREEQSCGCLCYYQAQ